MKWNCISGLLGLSLMLGTAAAGAGERQVLNETLAALLNELGGAEYFKLPDSHDLANIPQDPNNPLTAAKVQLGQWLLNDTANGTETLDPDRSGSYSCASCHHAAAGFKAGIPQGISDGGSGFANRGRSRRLSSGLDANAAEGDPAKPDLQPLATPTILNAAYQDVMLWNGSFGNTPQGVNASVAGVLEAGPPGIRANAFGLSGLETQALAGTRVHRLRFDNGSVLQTNRRYRSLYAQAYPDGDTGYRPPGSEVSVEALGAAKAIAAFERTILANRAPFQLWLHGQSNAMNKRQLRGALLFFGQANCVACHTGPALSSAPGASADRLFHAIGFGDFDTNRPRIHGSIPTDAVLGRGGFTGNPADNHAFKVPPLYNLKDTRALGHGASFRTVRQVVEYKNRAVPQRTDVQNLASGFVPLNLSAQNIDDLTAFIRKALYDPDLHRYHPDQVPSGACFPAADLQSIWDLSCF